MSVTEAHRPHMLSFSDYMGNIARHMEMYAGDDFLSPAEAIKHQVFALQRSPLWQAAYTMTTGQEFSAHPFMNYLRAHTGQTVDDTEIWQILGQDERNLTATLHRYHLYRKGAVATINSIFRDVVSQADDQTSVSEMKGMFQTNVAFACEEMRTGNTRIVPSFLLHDAQREDGQLLLTSLSEEIPTLEDTISDNIFDQVIVAQQNGLFEKEITREELDTMYPFPDYLFSTLGTPLPHSHTTCPAINHARTYFHVLIRKAMPYWQAGGVELERVMLDEGGK